MMKPAFLNFSGRASEAIQSFFRWLFILAAVAILFYSAARAHGQSYVNCPNGNCPRPLPMQSRIVGVCGSTKSAPPITVEYRQGERTVTRYAIGKEMERWDVQDDQGWHDWGQRLLNPVRTSFVDNSDRSKLYPVGAARFNKIAASRDCRECHATIRTVQIAPTHPTKSKSGIYLGTSLGISLVGHPIGGAALCPNGRCPQPSPVPTRGPSGSPGPAGPRGSPGTPGRDGADGRPGRDGVSPVLDYDKIADALSKRLPPIYIGAKDASGRVTMPATPVDLGDTVFIRVDPPSLVTKKDEE